MKKLTDREIVERLAEWMGYEGEVVVGNPEYDVPFFLHKVFRWPQEMYWSPLTSHDDVQLVLRKMAPDREMFLEFVRALANVNQPEELGWGTRYGNVRLAALATPSQKALAALAGIHLKKIPCVKPRVR